MKQVVRDVGWIPTVIYELFQVTGCSKLSVSGKQIMNASPLRHLQLSSLALCFSPLIPLLFGSRPLQCTCAYTSTSIPITNR
jgi:hypothetical protein